MTAAFAVTDTEHQATDSFPEFNPCTGEPGTLTITYNEVEHQSADANGGGHGTFTQTGTFTFEQDNGVTYTGKFTIWGGGNQNNAGTQVDTSIISLHGSGSDGSTIDANGVNHSGSNPAGTITSEFDKLNCR